MVGYISHHVYVIAAWNQVGVTCTKEDRYAVFWVGLDGWTDQTVGQAGSLAQCFGGAAHYYGPPFLTHGYVAY